MGDEDLVSIIVTNPVIGSTVSEYTTFGFDAVSNLMQLGATAAYLLEHLIDCASS
jgi:hypothetical protein